MYEQEYFERNKALYQLKDVRDFSIILRLLHPQPKETILDVGCGVGRLSYPLAGLGAKVIGIDVSRYAVNQARQRFNGCANLKFLCVNTLEMDYTEEFDKVICYHFLEHLTLPEARIALRKIYQALRPQGLLVVGIPINDSKPYRRAIRLLATGRQCRDPGHQTSFSPSEIEKELTSAGFELLELVPLSYFGKSLPKWFVSMPLLKEVVVACADICVAKGREST